MSIKFARLRSVVLIVPAQSAFLNRTVFCALCAGRFPWIKVIGRSRRLRICLEVCTKNTKLPTRQSTAVSYPMRATKYNFLNDDCTKEKVHLLSWSKEIAHKNDEPSLFEPVILQEDDLWTYNGKRNCLILMAANIIPYTLKDVGLPSKQVNVLPN